MYPVSKHHAIKAYKGSQSEVLYILNLDTDKSEQ
jgi:hypothetical protein